MAARSGYDLRVSTSPDYLPRKASALVADALTDTGIVVLNGARQAGKSTLARATASTRQNAVARTLDRPAHREAAASDPESFLQHDDLMVIDDVQRVPDLWLAMKAIVDDDPRPGRFLLTGSARLLALSSLGDALPGRTETIELWPLSQGEIDGAPDGFVEAAFDRGLELLRDPTAAPGPSPVSRSEYLERVARGGYPDVVARAQPRRRSRLLAGYLSDMISRDVHQVAKIEQADAMLHLLRLLAGQVSGVLTVTRLSSDLGISSGTVRTYLTILETVFAIKRVPAYASSQLTRATGAPKISFVDSGLASYLVGGLRTTSEGALLESFVLGELGRQLTWCDPVVQLFHYRDRDQHEVDAVLEDLSGRVVAVEVKASTTVRSDDFRGLRLLRDRLGDRFVAGFVLFCGADRLSFGDRLGCLPVSALWTTAP